MNQRDIKRYLRLFAESRARALDPDEEAEMLVLGQALVAHNAKNAETS